MPKKKKRREEGGIKEDRREKEVTLSLPVKVLKKAEKVAEQLALDTDQLLRTMVAEQLWRYGLRGHMAGIRADKENGGKNGKLYEKVFREEFQQQED